MNALAPRPMVPRRHVVSLALLALLALSPAAFAQTTAFTYQGRLTDNGSAASGNYDLQFTLFDAQTSGFRIGSTVTNSPVSVTSGLFTVTLDYGSNAFNGAFRWLEVAVRTNGSSGAFTTLSPRQAVTPTPYALYSFNAAAANSVASGAVTAASIQDGSITAIKLSNGQVVKSLNGVADNVSLLAGANISLATNGNMLQISARSGASGAWSRSGELLAAGEFLGTLNNLPLELKVNGARALRLEPNTNGAPNVIGGSPVNFVASGVVGATIGGGGATNTSFGAYTNSVESDFATIGGGKGNSIQTNASESTIGGGSVNTIQTGSEGSTIGGGEVNTIQNYAGSSTIGGGIFNTIQGHAYYSTIGGGGNNTIQTNAEYSTIAGGRNNTIQTNAYYSTIGGGIGNTIQPNSVHSTIGGGGDLGGGNTIQTFASWSTIGGGFLNTIETNASHSTIGGGRQNAIQAGDNLSTIGGGYGNMISGPYGVVPGGYRNSAGTNSFAAGHRANAFHTGAFVWADSQDTFFSSTATNQFSVRASGGVRLSDDTPALAFGSTTRQMLNLWRTNYAIGVQGNTFYSRSFADFSWFRGGIHSNVRNDPGAGGVEAMRLTSGGLTVNGTFVSSSDRNAKEGFTPVDPSQVLEKVARLPLCEWTFKQDTERSRHLGPMAQDFRAAFGLGADDKHIATVDADGVALAAIQGLHKLVKEKDAEVQQLKQSVAELKQLVETLAQQQKEGGQ